MISTLLAFAPSALSAIYPGNGGAWLVVGSRDNPSSAVAFARNLARQHSNVSVVLSNNGWYAITLGWTHKSSREGIKNRLVAQGSIPGDSYFHTGERFIEVVWSTSGVTGRSRSRILAATRLGSNSPQSPQLKPLGPGYVTGLKREANSYLSLRTGPSRSKREIKRMRLETAFDVLGERNGWYKIRLRDGTSGWAYGRYIAFGQAPLRTVTPVTPPKPAVPEIPQIVVDTSDAGLELEVAGLSAADRNYASLRKGPGTEFLEVARLRKKTKLTVTGKSGAWYRVKVGSSVEGWLSAQFAVAANIPLFGPEESEEPKPLVADPGEKKETGNAEEVAVAPTEKPQPAAASQGKRVALVLGNSAYEHTTQLANPKNDADKISTKLRTLGFEVIEGLDGGKVAMENSIRDFVRILTDADVALFFYAGHAMQVNGNNYLIPIDAKLDDATAIDFETIKLSSVLSFVDKPGRISIALLDACRDNPLSRRFARKLGPTRSAFLGRGLANPSSTGNLLIGFATAPGEVALDGDGENSPFTSALLNHIATPKLEVEAMLKKVRAEVFLSTSQQQSPWVNSGLRREFYFRQ